MLNRKSSGERWRERPDGKGKVTGELPYLTDLTADGMLVGRVLRSPHPHARVVRIRTERARSVPGVAAVLTHADVPGLNRFGIVIPDQPVLCEDVVRYVGDAVAAVAAESEEAAETALGLIEVDYEPLPIVSDPERALADSAPKLHPRGNELKRFVYAKGDAERALRECDVVVETTYRTPRQMHTYMETEGGLFVPERDGRLTVYSPTQHGLRDRMQLARILALPEADIRIVSSPSGGSFGGKDELNVQPYGALLALATGRPVKLHNSRRESVRAGIKRHPMTIRMRTGASRDGRLIAHEVNVIADTGAYATLGAEVLICAMENSVGCYRWDHLALDGRAVFTNNGVSGEFRGFGGMQTIFALEGQLDRLAERLGMDPWRLRERNLRRIGDGGGFGQAIAETDGAREVWEAVSASRLWRERQEGGAIDARSEPWLRVGIGAAIAMHGAGLGKGIADPAGGRLALAADGKIEAAFGFEEFGQGLLAALTQMLIEKFGFAAEDVRLCIGDTDAVPLSGTSTASRSTTIMWQALERLKPDFARRLLERAAGTASVPAERLRLGEGGVRETDGRLLATYAELAAAGEPIVCETSFAFPESPDGHFGDRFLFTYGASAVKVEVNELTGRVRVLDQFHAVAAGPVANPQGYLGQIEGGGGMALGFALTENAAMAAGHYLFGNLDGYLIPTIADQSRRIEVEAIDRLPAGDAFGPRGIGEIGSVTLAPAVASAVWDAVGRRVSELPICPAELQNVPDFAKEGA